MLFMLKKITAILTALTLLMSITLAQAQVSVGVKVGDWIEYNITTTGVPIEGHNLVWARMEILEVQGAEIRANVTSRADNGTMSSIVRFFNLQDGEVQAWVIIPANLGPGDTFYDKTINSTVTIQDEAQKTFAGATRTITHVSTVERDKQWDKATGVFVTTLDFLEGYTINATAVATNMWNPQILGLEPTIFYALVISVVIIVIASAVLIATRKKK